MISERTEGRATSMRPSRWSTALRHAVIARGIAVLAVVGGAVAGCRPTGTVAVDVVLTGLLAGVVTLAASRSSRWPLFGTVAAAILLARGFVLIPALASGVTVLLGGRRLARSRMWGAATGGLAIQALLRLPDLGFQGTSALVVAVVLAPVLWSGYRSCTRPERRRIRTGVVVAGAVVILVVGVGYGLVVLSVKGDIDRATDGARAGLQDTRQGDTTAALTEFEQANRAFGRADRRLNAWWAAPVRAVPILGQHAEALGVATEEGLQLTRNAAATVGRTSYSDLRSRGGQFDIARIESLRQPLARTAGSIASARQGLDRARSPWLLAPLSKGLDDLDEELVQAAQETDLAREGVAVAPELLGADGPRTYFVAFVTPAELRGSGGFVGSYAEISADDGQIDLVRSGSVPELERASPPGSVEVTGPPDYLARYGRFNPGEFFRDVTFSPNFPYDAQVISEIYPQSGGTEIDGVISIDPFALAALLELTGPIPVERFGRTLAADTAAQFLLRDNYALFQDNDAQNEALAELVESTFDRLTTGDLPGPRKLAEVLGPVTEDGRIRLWSPDPAEEAFFARLGATGAFPEPRPDHDFLAVASQNSGNNKIDVFQQRDIDYRVTVDDGGDLRATVEVTVRNPVPLDAELPDYVIGNAQGDPPGTNRMLLSIYTPHLLDRATLDGELTGVESQTEAGYRVYTRLLSVPPGGSVTLTLDLIGSLDVSDGYVLDLAPQPTVNSDELELRVGLGGEPPTTVGPFAILGRDEQRIPAP